MGQWTWKTYILELKKKKDKAKILNFNQILNEFDLFFFFKEKSSLNRTLNKYCMGKRNEIKRVFFLNIKSRSQNDILVVFN